MKDLNPHIRQAEAAYSARKFDRAAALFQQLCDLEEGVQPRWLQRLGDALRHTGERRGAVSAYTRAASAYASTDQPLKAVALCKVILSLEPGHTVTQHMLARLIARPTAFQRQENVSREQPQDQVQAPVSFAGTEPSFQPLGSNLAMSPVPALGETDPAMSFQDRELTGPPRPLPPGFDLTAQTPVGEASFDLKDIRPRQELAANPAYQAPLNEPTFDPEPALNPPAPAAPVAHLTPPAPPPAPEPRVEQAPPRWREGAARGDVSEPAIQELPPLVPLENIKLREVIKDATEEPRQETRQTGMFHIPLPGEFTSAAPAAASDTVDDLLHRMPRVPLLSSLDQASLRAFIEQVKLEAFYAGEKIITQGTAGTAMYIMVQGEVEVTTTEGGQTVCLGLLREGAVFGEVALVTASDRNVTVEAKSDVMALAVSRKIASRLVRQHPPVLKVLLRLVRDKLMATLAETHELFTPFGREERHTFMRLFKFFEARQGADMLVQGHHSPGMHLIMAGSAEVIRDGKVLREMGPGDIFGKSSIMANKPSLNSVRATRKCWVLRLDRRLLLERLMSHPKVVAALSQVAVTAGFPAFEHGAEPREQIKLI